MTARPRLPTALALLCAAFLGAAWLSSCNSADPPQSPTPPATPPSDAGRPTVAPTPPAVTVAAPATSPPGPEEVLVSVRITGEWELARVEAALGRAPGFGLVGGGTAGGETADLVLSDEPLLDAERIVLARWAAATDQRRDVLELTHDQVIEALTGKVTDWAEFGGSPQPLVALLAVPDAGLVAAAFGIPARELAVTLVPEAELLDRVAGTPGAITLLEPARLRLGVLALVVDGHDPYRDPANDSPLRDARWLAGGDPESATELSALLGFEPTPDFDPAGMIATGELIPARCSHAALQAIGRLGAMFDGTGDLIGAADVAVSPLEVSLTDRSPPTPCVSTFRLQGPAAAATAIADAGFDVVITAGNHAMDCWDGCSPGLALLDTLDHLRSAGLVTAGAGPDLEAARTPALFVAETLKGPVTFAFLGYDSIAAAFYGAGPGTAGTAPLDPGSVRSDVTAALARADHVIVGAGWGVEYTADPIPFQTDTALAAVASGATVVLGNHPHWVQAVEHFPAGTHPQQDRDAFVAYSMGNFVFDQDWSVETTEGMTIELGFTADRLLGYRIRPIVIRGTDELGRGLFRPEFVDPAGRGRPILDRIWDAQDRLSPR